MSENNFEQIWKEVTDELDKAETITMNTGCKDYIIELIREDKIRKDCVSQQLEPTLNRDLAGVLNKYSQENCSNTPDYILADYLLDCLHAYEKISNARDNWYTVDLHPGVSRGSYPLPKI